MKTEQLYLVICKMFIAMSTALESRFFGQYQFADNIDMQFVFCLPCKIAYTSDVLFELALECAEVVKDVFVIILISHKM